MGIVCHLVNGSEGHVHRTDHNITVTRSKIFVVIKRFTVAEHLVRLALGDG